MDLTAATCTADRAFYIIHDPAEDALNAPLGAIRLPLMIQDKKLNADNTCSSTPVADPYRCRGDIGLVNGMACHTSTWRRTSTASGCSTPRTRAVFALKLKRQVFQVSVGRRALDGNPLPSHSSASRRRALRHRRRLHAKRVGDTDVLQNANTTAPVISSLSNPGEDGRRRHLDRPATLSHHHALQASQATGQPVVSELRPRRHLTINGLTYDPRASIRRRISHVISELQTFTAWFTHSTSI